MSALRSMLVRSGMPDRTPSDRIHLKRLVDSVDEHLEEQVQEWREKNGRFPLYAWGVITRDGHSGGWDSRAGDSFPEGVDVVIYVGHREELEKQRAEARARATRTSLEVVQAEAIRYLLDQVQTNPDLGYQLVDSEAHAKLCRAEAALLGESEPAVKARRVKDLQPAHRRRKPAVVELKAKVDRFERFVDDVRGAIRRGSSGFSAEDVLVRFKSALGGLTSAEDDGEGE